MKKDHEQRKQFYTALGRLIRKKRRAADITQKQLAKKLAKKQVQTIYKLERGLLQVRFYDVVKLAKILNIDWDSLREFFKWSE
jgi:ribosome-binding protein aMBF1 (putative translation factor)